MNENMTYEEAAAYLYETPKFTKKNGLEHTRELLRRLRIEEERFFIIHVAGSNGKGSVCNGIQEALQRGGKRTGMFLSPHLVRMEERFCIDGRPCSTEQFLEAFCEVGCIVEQMREEGLAHPSFFEYLFAMGMCLFQRERVEYLVLETGLGGRLDCTNVFSKPLITVITSISLEHTEYLGETIGEVAAEKAGIIKEGVPVIYDASRQEAADVIREIAAAHHAESSGICPNSLKFSEFHNKHIDFCYRCDYDGDTQISIPFAAPYQMMNMALVYRTMRKIESVTGISKETILDAIAKIRWQGRMQEIRDGIYLDGAHNPAGIRSFLESLDMMKVQSPILLFSMMSDKNYEKSIRLLTEGRNWDTVFVTTVSDERGIPARKLAEVFESYGQKAVPVEDCGEAYRKAVERKRRGQTLFCTGSLYFIGELLEIEGGRRDD